MFFKSGNVRRVLALVVSFLAFQASVWAQGCAMCKAALESSPEGRFLAGSFAQGILMLLFLPYVIVGTVGFLVFRAYRKKCSSK